MQKKIVGSLAKRFYNTIINKQKIKFKWIKNRNLTPLLNVKVNYFDTGAETSLWNILFDKNFQGDFGLRKDGYLRRNNINHDKWLEIKESDWNLIQKHAHDKFNFRYLDWEKKVEAGYGDIFVTQGVIRGVNSKTLCLSQKNDIEVGTGLLTDRIIMERQVSYQAVNREYIFRLVCRDNDLYRALEEDKNITAYFNTQAQLEADEEGKTLSEKLTDYQQESSLDLKIDKEKKCDIGTIHSCPLATRDNKLETYLTTIIKKSVLSAPSSISEKEKASLKKFLEHYTDLMAAEIKEYQHIINSSHFSSKEKKECSEKVIEYQARIEEVRPYINKIR